MREKKNYIIRLYNTCSLIVFNTLVLLLIINTILSIWYYINEPKKSQPATSTTTSNLFTDDGAPVDTGNVHEYYLHWYDYNATREVSPSYAADVLKDFKDLLGQGFEYQPWVGFSEPKFQGKRVSIGYDERGFSIRSTPNPEKTQSVKTIRILTLGGSSTFGYSVADEQTWPAYLSTILNEEIQRNSENLQVEVINYGRAYYHPSQESALLIDLLKSGHRPHLVIFMDGINGGPYQDWPEFNDKAADGFRSQQFPPTTNNASLFQYYNDISLVKFSNHMANKMAEREIRNETTHQQDINSTQTDATVKNSEKIATMIVQRFLQNRKISAAVCQTYGCETLFFLQPNPRYNYNLDLYRMQLPKQFTDTLPFTKLVYDGILKSDYYIDLTGLFEQWGWDKKAIIDDTHYSPNFNKFLAQNVAKYIVLNRLKIHNVLVEQDKATGIIR